MSDNQRRLVCRLLFLLLCAAPTSLVSYWICHPQTTAQWETQILAQLGVQANIEHIETPFPYITILRDVELVDPELGPIFQAMAIEVNFETGQVLVRNTDRLTNAGIVRLMDAVNSNLIRRHAVDRLWRVDFIDTTVIEESIISARTNSAYPESMIVKNLQFEVNSQNDFTGVRMGFQLAEQEETTGDDSDHWVSGMLVRRIGNSSNHQEFELKTWGLELPCWLLADVVPQLDKFGINCKFSGEANIVPTAGAPAITLSGRFTDFDPSAVRQAGYPDAIAGKYTVVVNSFRANNASPGEEQFEIDGVLIAPNGFEMPIPRLALAAGNQNVDVIRTARDMIQSRGGTMR